MSLFLLEGLNRKLSCTFVFGLHDPTQAQDSFVASDIMLVPAATSFIAPQIRVYKGTRAKYQKQRDHLEGPSTYIS